ncbi:MAG: hypothetical protein E7294_05755 [Lachnospiraceae bacterium]|jgi:long-chain acyl-CoA synthetase|nr:hypothetical protein [Lachnospiraceae bacterium]
MKNFYYDTVIYDSFAQMLRGWQIHHPDKAAIRYRDGEQIVTVTYRELVRQTCCVYQYFKEQGIEGSHIGIVSENRYEYIVIYLASVLYNVIAPLDKELDAFTLAETIGAFDINVLWYTAGTKKKLEAVPVDGRVRRINIDEIYTGLICREVDVEGFLTQIQPIDKDKFSVLASTSGTDGKMKGVMLSQYNVVVNIRGTLENNILKTPTLALLPMNHTYGFNPGILATLYNGTCVCLNLNLKHLARDLKEYDPFFFEAVPMVFEGIYKNILREVKRQNKYPLFCRMIKLSQFLLKFHIDVRHLFFGEFINPGLRLAVSGGASLNPVYVERYAQLGIELLNGYGMTECSPTVAVSMKRNNVAGSAGTIMRHIDVKIAQDGEILVKGPNVMLGYYKDEQATAECMEDGYFKTGDLGYVEGKVIFVTGRKKNLIILGNGKNFSPEAVEKKLLELPYVTECIVTSRVESNNEIVVAKVYMEKPEDRLEDDIRQINKTLPGFMKIDRFEIMEKEFEKNSSRKIRRNMYAG